MSPFIYPGGKSRAAELIWSALGKDVASYAEPFSGSAAVLLKRPGGAGKYETINDADGLVVNAWRAIKLQPDAVAVACDGPPCELDMQARAAWIRANRDKLISLLNEHPDAHSVEAAAWWLCCQALALDWNWSHEDGRLGFRTSNRVGVYAIERRGIISGFLQTISDRLNSVLVMHGDWQRVVSDGALGLTVSGRTPIGIFFDPPYKDEAIDYGSHNDVASDVESWCAERGDDPKLRIVIAGHTGDYNLPGWRNIVWGGSRGVGRARRGKNECLWFSPACLKVRESRQTTIFDLLKEPA